MKEFTGKQQSKLIKFKKNLILEFDLKSECRAQKAKWDSKEYEVVNPLFTVMVL